MKYHIEKNSPQETLVIPFFARKMRTDKFPSLFKDETATWLIDSIDYDFSDFEKKVNGTAYSFGALEVAMRQSDTENEVMAKLGDGFMKMQIAAIDFRTEVRTRSDAHQGVRLSNGFPETVPMHTDRAKSITVRRRHEGSAEEGPARREDAREDKVHVRGHGLRDGLTCRRA